MKKPITVHINALPINIPNVKPSSNGASSSMLHNRMCGGLSILEGISILSSMQPQLNDEVAL